MSVHDFGKPATRPRQKRDVTLTQQIPAYRADDTALEQVWRAVEAKCAEAGKPSGSLTVYETLPPSGRGVRERRESEYRSIDDLRLSSDGPDLLREYTLSVSSPWGDDFRRVRVSAGGVGTASVVASAPDADWCREAADAVLGLLRPHATWYAIVHRMGLGGLFIAYMAVLAALLAASLRETPLGFVELAVYLALLAAILIVMFWRDRLFPPADIRVERRPAKVAVIDRPPTADHDAVPSASRPGD